tara:strand:+ start:7892 stop:8023 length:132 start_codon:yes stop_codon:yes gene_type:complete
MSLAAAFNHQNPRIDDNSAQSPPLFRYVVLRAHVNTSTSENAQ